MINNKFYVSKSRKTPTHPEKLYGVSWETGVAFYGMIFPKNISFDDWKKKQIEGYEKRLKQFNETGEYFELILCLENATNLEEIEKEIDFVKWC